MPSAYRHAELSKTTAHLFNPAHWVAFGRIDAFVVSVFGDFDPMIGFNLDVAHMRIADVTPE